MLINISSATEVWDDQPAGENQLCVRPDRDPVVHSQSISAKAIGFCISILCIKIIEEGKP